MEAILLLLVLSNFLLLAFFGIKSIKDYYTEKEKRAKLSDEAKKDYADLLKRPWALDSQYVHPGESMIFTDEDIDVINSVSKNIKSNGFKLRGGPDVVKERVTGAKTKEHIINLRNGVNYTFGDVKEFCGRFIKKDHEGFAFFPIYNKCYTISDDGLVRFAKVSGIYEVPFIEMEELKNIKKPMIEAEFTSKDIEPKKYSINNIKTLKEGENYFNDLWIEFRVIKITKSLVSIIYTVSEQETNLVINNCLMNKYYKKALLHGKPSVVIASVLDFKLNKKYYLDPGLKREFEVIGIDKRGVLVKFTSNGNTELLKKETYLNQFFYEKA